jgi:serine/threonine protein phosphatase PrpC
VWVLSRQLMAVFDGHGPFGHLVSDRLRVMIPPSLFGQPMFPTNMEQALQAAINEVENIILQGVWLLFSYLRSSSPYPWFCC